MAALSFSARTGAVTTPNRVTLTASDSFTFVPNTNQVLELHNTTGAPITAVIKGSAPSAAYAVPNAGTTTVDLTTGFSVTVPATTGAKYVQLDAIAAYLAGNGTVTITGATGALAVLLSN